MSNEIFLSLPWPPSVNCYWLRASRHQYIGPKGRDAFGDRPNIQGHNCRNENGGDLDEGMFADYLSNVE